jgi:hypothetical protein
MAHDEAPPNLLSKVAGYVRDAAARAKSQADPLKTPAYDKQALKEIIERKRLNDQIRRLEFDYLRKLLNQGSVASVDLENISLFLNSSPSGTDGRASTLKKINEIEAQMSKLWGKGVSPSDAAAHVRNASALAAQAAQVAQGFESKGMASTRLNTTQLQTTFMTALNTQKISTQLGPQTALGAAQSTWQASVQDTLQNTVKNSQNFQISQNSQSFEPNSLVQDTRSMDAPNPAKVAPQTAPKTGAKAGAKAAAPASATAPPEVQPTAQKSRFHTTAQWIDNSALPPTLNSALNSALDATLDTALRTMPQDSESAWMASRLLLAQVDEVANDTELEEAAIQFANGDDAAAEKSLLDALHGPKFQPECAAAWAAALLDLYCATQRPNDFAHAAQEWSLFLDGAAPQWSQSHGQVTSGSGSGGGLQGVMLGDASAQLERLDTQGLQSGVLLVDCKHLQRVDFPAAGSILNWVIQQEARGIPVQFHNLHRLVATFFNIIGIQEHAKISTSSL